MDFRSAERIANILKAPSSNPEFERLSYEEKSLQLAQRLRKVFSAESDSDADNSFKKTFIHNGKTVEVSVEGMINEEGSLWWGVSSWVIDGEKITDEEWPTDGYRLSTRNLSPEEANCMMNRYEETVTAAEVLAGLRPDVA